MTAESQGCADIGVCYPPQLQKITVALPAAGAGPGAPVEAVPAEEELVQMTASIAAAQAQSSAADRVMSALTHILRIACIVTRRIAFIAVVVAGALALGAGVYLGTGRNGRDPSRARALRRCSR